MDSTIIIDRMQCIFPVISCDPENSVFLLKLPRAQLNVAPVLSALCFEKVM